METSGIIFIFPFFIEINLDVNKKNKYLFKLRNLIIVEIKFIIFSNNKITMKDNIKRLSKHGQNHWSL